MMETAEKRKSLGEETQTQLQQLKRFTRVVADTGDFSSLKKYEPEDATTNPSLLLKSAQKAEYKYLVEKTMSDWRAGPGSNDARQLMENLLVAFGVEILKVVPGRVSTETDAELSFDAGGLEQQARRFIALYERQGVPRERVLVKLATTWEGIQAARTLQKEGINCNMTLLFSLAQAVACADAGARLISPFVGRILDWYKAKSRQEFTPEEDPGVKSVRQIYTYYKKFGYETEVMGASFRNTGEILQLAGCDLLTISPKLMDELMASKDPVQRRLDPAAAREAEVKRLELDEKRFRWLLNQDAMATEKLAEGIRTFHADAKKLKKYLASLEQPKP